MGVCHVRYWMDGIATGVDALGGDDVVTARASGDDIIAHLLSYQL
jgi:hypothetical protein